MVAGKNARFLYEQHSWFRAGHLAKQTWGIAAEVGASAFVPELGQWMLDDHVPLQRVGIPAIDIIDMNYPHWHKLSDVPENCSGATMEQVARVLAVWRPRAR
jgi:glutaminyl-peptide cyclotransferase